MKKSIFIFIILLLTIATNTNVKCTKKYNEINGTHYEAQGLQIDNYLRADPGGGM
ncbi:hypothetical protein V7024_18340 [Bacillus sp. JJ864]|uniref:hypothetical protein n=1 Tax=Bacillus sp. JJ864 TaxID=3122975 RepID=UPI002FFD8801